MAWRDSRGSRGRLFLFLLSMVLGVGALVAINSFGVNLRRAVDAEAKTLLGADLSFERGGPFTPRIRALADSLGGETAERVSFPSMAYFPRTEGTRLATVRATRGAYPFYGEVVTNPPEAARNYTEGRNALVDGLLLESFGVGVGDSVQIGNVRYRIAGEVLRSSREADVASLFSPRVYVPLAALDSSLLGLGSRADYEMFFRFDDGRDVDAVVEQIRPQLREARVRTETVSEVQDDWNTGLDNLYRFLSLVAFIALLLGGLGVASSVHVFVQSRLQTVAVLRCLGASTRKTFTIYLLQAFGMGLLAGVLGGLLGLVVLQLLPILLADFLPVSVQFSVYLPALLLGLGLGVGATLLFALLPLLGVRRVSPLRALRVVDDVHPGPLRWLVFLLIAAGIGGFAYVQAPDWRIAAGYAVGVGVVFGLLALVAKLLTFGARRFFPSKWPYVARQGLANLYRPRNQTLLLLLSLGLGTFLLLTLIVVERTLLSQFTLAGGEGRPNLVLFDVQPEQLDGVAQRVEAAGLPVIERVPIVTMRLQRVKNYEIDQMRLDSLYRDSLTWAHTREYRSSYREYLNESETLVAGEFTPSVPARTKVVPVSLEKGLAGELNVTLGDTLVFNVQGRPMKTIVGSIREVDWRRLSTNFFVVFPSGVLEKAPQNYVVLTRTEDDAQSARLQSAVVRDYPNVSSIDLTLALGVFDAIFGRVASVIRFMALFSILTGLFVLAGAILVSRYRRAEETVLLKTLGASRRQVLAIMLVEYALLGVLGAVTGLVLAAGAGWGLARFVFQTPLAFPLSTALLTVAIVALLTLGIGFAVSRGLYRRPPLEVLRAEG